MNTLRNFNVNLSYEERLRIGGEVKKLRNEMSISQRELARLTGLSPTRIVDIENGATDYRIDSLIVILLFFGRKISII